MSEAGEVDHWHYAAIAGEEGMLETHLAKDVSHFLHIEFRLGDRYFHLHVKCKRAKLILDLRHEDIAALLDE